jgi:ABC-type multidrug transport system ATPase subunit
VIPVLETTDLSKNYGSLLAVNRINLAIEKGTSFGLLGPNGSGKTTTLGMILSVLTPSGGTFKWFGNTPEPAVYKKIGSLLETPNFFPYLSLNKNLEIHARIKMIPAEEVGKALDQTGLLNRAGSRYDTLSLGMKQRLGIAAVLLGNPEVLVLDEPANGLDPEGIAEIRNLITGQRERGRTIILASHILDEVEKVCTHAGILKQGKLIVSGRVSDLLKGGDVVMIKADKPVELQQELLASGLATEVRITDEIIEVLPSKGITTPEINKFAIGKGISINEIWLRKNTLEEQFLEMVKNKEPENNK